MSASNLTEILEANIIEAIKQVHDPEIPVNIYDLGLIYDIDIDKDLNATITMTLTSPNCPVAGSLPGEVEAKAKTVEGIKNIHVALVWDPPWSYDRMSEVARLELGYI